MKLIVENELAIVNYDEEKKTVFSVYSGIPSPESLMEILQAILAFSETSRVVAIIGDITGLKGTFTSMNDYILNDYYPPLIERGLKIDVLVVSKEVFAQFELEDLGEIIGGVEVKMFDSMEVAKEWVFSNVEILEAI